MFSYIKLMFSYLMEGHGGAGIQGCDYNAAVVDLVPCYLINLILFINIFISSLATFSGKRKIQRKLDDGVI